MKASAAIFGEPYPWQVGAVFDDERAARRAAAAVRAEENLAPDQVAIFKPQDVQSPEMLNPRSRSRGIAHTLVRAHVVLGILGALGGLVVGLALLAAGVGPFASNAVFATALTTALGLVAGLLLGGLVSLRPDQDVLRLRLEKAMAEGDRWAVVVHARDHGEGSRVGQALRAWHGTVIAAL